MANKRRGAPLAVCALMLGVGALTACGKPSDAAGSDKPLIGVSMRFIAGNSWLSTLNKATVDAGNEQGYRVLAVDAQGDAARQVQQMKSFIAQGAKAIIIEPVHDKDVAAGITAAKDAGVKVVVVNDRVADELATQVACNVYDDGAATAKLVGAETAKAIASRKPAGSTIKLYIQALFPDELVTQTRENGFMAGWNEYFQAHRGYKIVRIPNNYGEAQPDKTLAAMRGVLTAHPDIDVVFNQTDVVMPSVKEALKSARLMKADGSSTVLLAGFDGGMDVVRDMADNPRSPAVADGLNQPPTQAAYSVEEAIAAIKGTQTGQCAGSPPTRIVPPKIATPQNAKELVNPDLKFAGA
ncbi:monosaccharide ABC transporter substrate-binding protein, CUT2 family [Micromonospora pattaloongensis]|uniref:Monosaccharide ABC transporter substrate-binding protein, CUT2 family n=1 Tax=Micromonospora pattaloongensis TaxID=405436 RepID=A0A1H3RXA0_9ACTN|nr:substrate-binding domain-containing protein [Micromonospora pattaloongensis]SDZ30230.1 monosaccharide ABC transporter substrate-binding protein, CUT2 family [Micromonospora pattaloongensis]